MYSLAEKLGKFAHEVLQIPHYELEGWLVYLDWKAKQNEHGR